MPLFDTALLAALEGITEVLPVSRSGHAAVARLWLSPGETGEALTGVLRLGTALALGVVARERLAEAMSEGVRGIARPSLFRTSDGAKDAAALVLASAASMIVGAILRPYFEMWSGAPVAAGLGLLMTGLAIASIYLAPRPYRKTPTLAGALAVGIAHGAASFPGASRVGIALTLLLWFGVRPGRALDLALLITIPGLLAASAQATFGAGGDGDGGAPLDLIALGAVIAFISAAIGAAVLRGLVARRRVGALALWVIPLGLATLAYARSLPGAAAAEKEWACPPRGSDRTLMGRIS